MRILFFGDGRWAGDTLRRLLAEGHDIPLIVERTRPTDGALADVARLHGIELVRPDDVNDTDFVTKIASLAGDLNVSVSFDQILKRPIVSTPPLGFVNVHAGMLPFYRGRNVVNWALINGETEIGLTAHFVDQGIDTGDIIAQVSMPILWTDTYADVLEKVVAAIPDLTARVVADIGSRRVTRRAQHELAGTYFPARRRGDEWIDWSDSSRNIYNKIRAITRPGPGALTISGHATVKLWQAQYSASWPRYIATPGEVVGRQGQEGAFVKTGDSIVLVTYVELDGHAPAPPCWTVGTRLGLNLPQAFRELQDRLEKLEQMLGRAASGIG